MNVGFNIILGTLIVVLLVYTTNVIGHISHIIYSDGHCDSMLSYEGVELFSSKQLEKITMDDTQLPLSEMTPFEWDTLHVVQPYASDLTLIRLFGFRPSVLGKTCIYLHDDRNLLAFIKDDQIVVYGEVLRENVQFQRYDTKNKRWFDHYSLDICMQKREGVLHVESCNY